MWSAVKHRLFFRKIDRHLIRNTHEFGLDKVKPIPVPDIVRKPPRLPFLKSIYGGQYDTEVLTYPETLNLERYKDLDSRLQQIKHNCTKVDTIRQLGLFAMSVPYACSGLNLSDTEIARIFEHFDYNMFKLVLDHTISVDIIKTFGTPNQKSKYLPLLASGALCSFHNNTLEATQLPNQSWELSGSVKNSTDVFLICAIKDKAYIIEKDKTFINNENLELRQVIVPTDNVINNVNLIKIMNKSKLYTCSTLISLLKQVVQSTTNSVLPKTRLNLKLREYDSVLKILAKSSINIYTIESMIYLTTWMTDGFEDPDIELETAAIQLFVHQTVGTTLTELKLLYGRNSIYEPFLSLCNNVDDLLESLETNIELSNFISKQGIKFFNESNFEENISFLTKAYRNIMMKRNEPSLKYGLQQFLHPALMHTANFAEYCILKFQYIIDHSHNAGQLSIDNHMLMERLSTIITHIYAMTAVVGRASRSYCTGIRFCDYEMNAAETVVRETRVYLQPIIDELLDGKYIASDSVYESLVDNNIKREKTKT